MSGQGERVRRTIGRGVRVLIVLNVAAVAFLLIAVIILSTRSTPPGHPAQSPSASVELMPMGLAHIPTSNSCLLCHETGGEAGLKPVPALGHPLEGWRQCLTCHTNEKLGRTAPGHQGITEDECLNCHKVAQPGPAITQPHAKLHDQKCLDCHGGVAHLPSSMVGRNQDECWLCHKPTASPPPEYPHPAGEPLNCRECHQSPQVGGLPIDHALRSDSTCLLCHEIAIASPSPGGTAAPSVTLAPRRTATPSASPAGG